MWTAAPVIGQVFVQVAQGRHTSDLTYEERKNMGPEESAEWAYGSQMFLFGLTGYFVILWTLKFNMLCFYSRVVRSLWTEKFIKPIMGFVCVSAVVIVLTLALTCRPFQHLWQVWPDPGREKYHSLALPRIPVANRLSMYSALCAAESRLLSRHYSV